MAIFSSLFDTPFVKEVTLGVMGVIVLKVVEISWAFLRETFFSPGFKIRGYWIATFESYVNEKDVVEIVKFAGKNDKLKVTIQHYNSGATKLRGFKGVGIVRGNSVSFIYYDTDPAGIQSGAASLVVHQGEFGEIRLVGHYAEWKIGRDQNNIAVARESYLLNPKSLDIERRIKFNLGLPCYEDYLDAQKHSNQ